MDKLVAAFPLLFLYQMLNIQSLTVNQIQIFVLESI